MNEHQTSIVGITGKNNKSLHILANSYHLPFNGEEVLSTISKLSHKPDVNWETIHNVESWLTSMDENKEGDIFTVDMDGTIYIFSESSSKKIDLNCPEGLNDVITFTKSEAFTISLEGKIVKLKGTQFDVFEDTLHRRLNAIHGSSNSNIYVSGDNGIIFYYNGNIWKELQTPTNVNLLSVHCVSKNEIYFGGTSGTLLQWNGENWKSYSNPEFNINLTGLAFFNDNLHISAGKNGVFVLKDENIEKLKELTVYKLKVINDRLFGIGNSLVAQYDGENWWGGNLDI